MTVVIDAISDKDHKDWLDLLSVDLISTDSNNVFFKKKIFKLHCQFFELGIIYVIHTFSSMLFTHKLSLVCKYNI